MLVRWKLLISALIAVALVWVAGLALMGRAPLIPAGCGRPVREPVPPEARRSAPPGPRVPEPYYHQVQVATSPDGMNWQVDPRILYPHMSVPDVTLLSNGRLLMIGVDFSQRVENLMASFSLDGGKTWGRLKQVKLWGYRGRAVDPDIMEIAPHCYRLTFFGMAEHERFGQGAHRIYSAVSSDGLNFVLEEGVRVEGMNLHDPDIIKVGETWMMYIGRALPGTPQATVVATSADGLAYSEPQEVATGSIPGAVVLADGRVRLYTVDRSGMTAWISDDGLRFQREGPVVGLRGADPAPVLMTDGSYLMIHKTFMR